MSRVRRLVAAFLTLGVNPELLGRRDWKSKKVATTRAVPRAKETGLDGGRQSTDWSIMVCLYRCSCSRELGGMGEDWTLLIRDAPGNVICRHLRPRRAADPRRHAVQGQREASGPCCVEQEGAKKAELIGPQGVGTQSRSYRTSFACRLEPTSRAACSRVGMLLALVLCDAGFFWEGCRHAAPWCRARAVAPL